ncbi:MAG: ATP-binding protein [Nitrososphaerota archaeon]
MSDTRKNVGIVVGEANPTEFYFVAHPESPPSRWEYVLVKIQEEVGGELQDVELLAQVENIYSASEALRAEEDLEALRKIVEADIGDVRLWGRARVLGYLQGSKLVQPRRSIKPGQAVYIADRGFLEGFYSFPEDESLFIGGLITRPEVKVALSLKGFRRHLAILAQTGAGKSYCAGVLIEELLEKGGTVVVIDPHADYVLMGINREGEPHELSGRITVFRNPSSSARHDVRGAHIRTYEIAFRDLLDDEIFEIADVSERYTQIMDVIRKALDVLRERGNNYTPKDLLSELERIASDEEEKRENRIGATRAMRYVRKLLSLTVFGQRTTPTRELLVPMHASIVDLSGLNDRSLDYIASKILNDVYSLVVSGEYEYPVFLFVEEAHKFIPPKRERTTLASEIIKKIAAEGRKFGIFLVLITQRPSRIDEDALSQCNSQIIMRLTNPRDQEAVRNSSERMSEDLLRDLPGLNVGDAVIVGEVVKAPVMVRIRERRTMEGGSDIDVVEKLRRAREEVGRARNSAKSIGEMYGYG